FLATWPPYAYIAFALVDFFTTKDTFLFAFFLISFRRPFFLLSLKLFLIPFKLSSSFFGLFFPFLKYRWVNILYSKLVRLVIFSFLIVITLPLNFCANFTKPTAFYITTKNNFAGFLF